jgi:hypothetical protein
MSDIHINATERVMQRNMEYRGERSDFDKVPQRQSFYTSIDRSPMTDNYESNNQPTLYKQQQYQQ